MPTLTVLAPDSALAMDEIARQLGEDAFILSTSQRDGMIEIRATNDPLAAMPRAGAQARVGGGPTLADLSGEEEVTVLHRARTAMPARRDVAAEAPTPGRTPAPGDDSPALRPRVAAAAGRFGRDPADAAAAFTFEPVSAAEQGEDPAPFDARVALAEAMGTPLPAPAPRLPTRQVAQVSGHGSARRVPEAAPGMSQPEGVRGPGASVHALPFAGNAAAGGAPLRLADLEDLRRDLAEIRAQIATLLTHQRAVAPPPAVAAVVAESAAAASFADFAPALIADLADAGGDVATAKGFATALARRVVAPAPEGALDAGIVVVLGPSGAGRTSLAAKLAALAAELRPERACKLIEFSPAGATQANDALRRHARLLSYAHGYDIACERWHERDLERATSLPTDTLHVIDMPAFPDLAERGAAILNTLARLAPMRRILALPGALGGAAIRAHLARPEAVGAEVALTKLDEGEIMPPELSTLALAGGRIGWLSGTGALVGNLSPASEAILRDYVGECLDRAPAGTEG